VYIFCYNVIIRICGAALQMPHIQILNNVRKQIIFLFKKGNILKVEEVAKILKVNKRTVYRWIDSKNLKAMRIGRKTYRIFEADLEKFLNKYAK
jgi:excisionase family DNA binding protein